MQRFLIRGSAAADAQILPYIRVYLRIVACGLIFHFLYNFLSGTLRALGDSVTPLYFLALSAGLNIIGDRKMTLVSSVLNMGMRFASCLLYVFVLHMGIEAVPWACFTGWTAMLLYEGPLLWKACRCGRI